MKKHIPALFLFLALFVSSSLHSQSPQGIPYQAVMRNADGTVMASSEAVLTFMIHDGTANGTVVYQESHSLTSNAQGLVSCVVGNGVVSEGNFSNIDWGGGAKFLHVMMGSVDLGTQQMLSVPYSLHSSSSDNATNATNSQTAANGFSHVSANGDTLYLSNGQIFVASTGGNSGTGSLVLPLITTNAVNGVTSNSATLSGVISNANGNVIMERGFVYSTSPHPTINGNKIVVGNGIGAFDTITDLSHQYAHLLTPNTTYYVRAYAITENNISAYGNEVGFTTLSVGDIGPGGGWVFFNKGNMEGGWQYLETAPMDQSTGIQWGCYGTSISGTQVSVGSGENNTALIVANCPGNHAAQLCSDLTLGGQTDWFLPSRDETNLMYQNLKVSGLVNFTSTFYWSSSEYGSFDAWDFYFGSGYPSFDIKVTNYYVRAVRAF
jgi:hypothetical protein